MSKFLEDIKSFIAENHYNVYSVSEIKDGNEPETVIIQNVNACQDSYSVAKAFVVTAVGMLHDRGLIDVNQNAAELLGDECPADISDEWKNITVDNLLRHRAGLPGGCLDIDSLDCRDFGEDYLAYLMKLPSVCPPGTERVYSDGAYYMLARICEKITGENLSAFLWRELFYKLGFREVAWSCCPKGHCMGATGLYIRSEDMVKLGEVYLEGGTYKGQRIISSDWVDTVLSVPYEMSKSGIGNIYGKGGMHRQQLFVDSDKKRAVAFHAYGDTDREELMRFEYNYSD